MKSINSAFRLNRLTPAFCFGITLLSQSQSPRADVHLSGTVTDPSGACAGRCGNCRPIAGTRQIDFAPIFTSSADGSYTLSSLLLATITPFLPSYAICNSSNSIVDLARGHRARLTLLWTRRSSNVLVTAQSRPVPVTILCPPTSASPAKKSTSASPSSCRICSLSHRVSVFARTGANGGTRLTLSRWRQFQLHQSSCGWLAHQSPRAAPLIFLFLTTDNIDKVEIVRGAESAIYGTDAVSGVVQLFTHRGATTRSGFLRLLRGWNLFLGAGGWPIQRSVWQISTILAPLPIFKLPANTPTRISLTALFQVILATASAIPTSFTFQCGTTTRTPAFRDKAFLLLPVSTSATTRNSSVPMLAGILPLVRTGTVIDGRRILHASA